MAEATQSWQQHLDDDGRLRRTGTVWSASAHIITAVMGSGVLSLTWAIAQLGWIAGPTLIFLFSFITCYTSTLLAACYRSEDSVAGQRNYTYMDAVRATLGECQAKLSGASQYLNLAVVAIGIYVIAASKSMIAIQRSHCLRSKGINGQCKVSAIPYTIAFGVVELFVSQIPDFGQIWWLSVVSAIMSLVYSTIGIVLGVAKIAEAGEFSGSLTGIRIGSVTKAQKIFQSLQAIGSIAEAYSFSVMLLEIQDTIKSTPSEYKTMKKATRLSLFVATIFYMFCGCFGYAAFGDLSPGNLLTGFDFLKHYWLLQIANAAIVIHHIGAYQVCCQPIFAFIKKSASEYWFPERGYLFRFVWRTIFVVITTIISMLVAFFNDAPGVLGALGFWRLSVYLPLAMYIFLGALGFWRLSVHLPVAMYTKQNQIRGRKWICLQILSMSFLLISIAGAVGSLAALISDVKDKRASQH